MDSQNSANNKSLIDSKTCRRIDFYDALDEEYPRNNREQCRKEIRHKQQAVLFIATYPVYMMVKK